MNRLARSLAPTMLAAALVAATPARAEGTRIALPLTAPESASPLLADFLEICSLALLDRAVARAQAQERGWVDMSGETPLEEAFKAEGNFSAQKVEPDGVGLVLLANRTEFAHETVDDCTLQSLGTAPDLDLTPIAEIDGVLSGSAPYRELDPQAGAWSFVDKRGEVVTIRSVPSGGVLLALTMARQERAGTRSGSGPASSGRAEIAGDGGGSALVSELVRFCGPDAGENNTARDFVSFLQAQGFVARNLGADIPDTGAIAIEAQAGETGGDGLSLFATVRRIGTYSYGAPGRLLADCRLVATGALAEPSADLWREAMAAPLVEIRGQEVSSDPNIPFESDFRDLSGGEVTWTSETIVREGQAELRILRVDGSAAQLPPPLFLD